MNDARDEIGLFAKDVPPVVANGKLYVTTFWAFCQLERAWLRENWWFMAC